MPDRGSIKYEVIMRLNELKSKSNPVYICSPNDESKPRMFNGYVKKVLKGEAFVLSIRRTAEQRDFTTQLVYFKDGDEERQEFLTSEEINWNINSITFESVTKRFRLRKNDMIVFQFRTLDKCGIGAEWSEFLAYDLVQKDDGLTFVLGE